MDRLPTLRQFWVDLVWFVYDSCFALVVLAMTVAVIYGVVTFIDRIRPLNASERAAMQRVSAAGDVPQRGRVVP